MPEATRIQNALDALGQQIIDLHDEFEEMYEAGCAVHETSVHMQAFKIHANDSLTQVS